MKTLNLKDVLKHTPRFDRSVYIEYSQPNRLLKRKVLNPFMKVLLVFKHTLNWWFK